MKPLSIFSNLIAWAVCAWGIASSIFSGDWSNVAQYFILLVLLLNSSAIMYQVSGGIAQ